MNTRLTHTTLYAFIAAALTTVIVACGGAGGLAGIGGSGYIATGTITGFGSVFVNGIEFETDTAAIEVDGVSGKTQDDLAIGMVVTINGSVNADGISGTADTILFDDDVQGPVASLTPASGADADGNRSFEIFGVTVRADADTVFDIDDDAGLPAGTVFDIDTLAEGNNVEISGFMNAAGEINATRVELKDQTLSASSEVEIKGTISVLVNTSFVLNGIQVDAGTARLEDLPNGLVDGDYVEVKGSYNAGSNTLTATTIEAEDGTGEIDDTAGFSVEGLVTDYDGSAIFKVNGITIDASSAAFTPANLTLANGVRIEAEGPVVNNVLQATSIEARSGEVRVQAAVSAADPDTDDFAVKPVASQGAISILVTTSTEMEADIMVGDFVELRGYLNADGTVTATRIELKDPDDDVVVQGIMESGASSGTISVLGVEFQIDYPAETEFEDTDESSLTETEFFSKVIPDSSRVKIEDRSENGLPANGIADVIEIR
jgi:hypothetical protein